MYLRIQFLWPQWGIHWLTGFSQHELKGCYSATDHLPRFCNLQDFRTHADQSCRYSEEFVNIYYDCMDKKRRVCVLLLSNSLYTVLFYVCSISTNIHLIHYVF